MKKLLLIAVVVVGTSALVLAGRGGDFGRQAVGNGPGWMHSGPGGGFGRQGFAKGPGWMHSGFRGRGQFGPLCNWQDSGSPAMRLGMLDLTDEQKESVKTLVEESRAKLHADIEAVLTPEQVEKFRQLRESTPGRSGGPGRGYLGVGPRGPLGGPGGTPPVLAALDLTEDQKAQIEAIREQARTDAEAAETWQVRQDIMQTAHEEVLSVLTDEQIETLEQSCPRTPCGRGGQGRGQIGIGPRGPYAGPDGPLAALDLTEDQKAQIEAIREQAGIDAEAAETWQARRDIMQTAHDEVLSVLTDEQIETLEQSYPRTSWGRGGQGRGRW